MRELVSVLQSIGNIPGAEIDRFIELSTSTTIAKGSYFIREGYSTNRLGFVKEGLFRNMYLTKSGEECTFAFSAENEFIYECQAMRTAKDAAYSIQALEDSIVVEVDYKQWADTFKDSAWWNKILLDWTIVRAATLKDGSASGEYTVGNTMKTGHINRSDVADFLIKQVTDRSYTNQAITITS